MRNAVASICTGNLAADRPSPERIIDVLTRVGEALGEHVCWLYDGSFHFRLPEAGWTIAVTPESARRFRLESCRATAPRSTVWVLEDDDARLARVVQRLADEVRARLAL